MLGISTDSATERALATTTDRASIWRNRPFLFVFAGYCVSLLGNTFHGMALNLWVIQSTGSAKLMSAIVIVHLLSSVLLGSFAGTVADRMDRRTLMVAADAVRFLLVLSIALAMLIPGTPFFVLIVLTALVSFASHFHAPSFQASLGGIVGDRKVHQAVGVIHIADNVIRISGFALGGVVVAAYGGVVAITVDAFTFLASGSLIFLAGKFPSTMKHAKKTRAFKTDLLAGFNYLWKDSFLRSVVAMSPLLFLFFLSMLMLIQVMAVQVWHASPFEFGLIESCIPLGYVVGSGIILGSGNKMAKRGRWILGSVVLMGPVYYLLSQAGSVAFALPFILCAGLLFSFGTLIINVSLRLRVAPDIQGRVFGTLGSLTSVAPPIGIAVSSYLSDLYGPSTVIAFGGASLFALAIVGCISLKAIRQFD